MSLMNEVITPWHINPSTSSCAPTLCHPRLVHQYRRVFPYRTQMEKEAARAAGWSASTSLD